MISEFRGFFLRLNGNPWFLISQVFLTFVFTNGIFGHFACRKDLSASGRFEISESTKRIFKNLNSPLFIDAYYSSKVPGEYKVRLDLAKELLNEMTFLGGSKITIRFHDPDTSEEDRKKAIEAGIEPQILEKTERGSAQVKQVFMGITLSIGVKKETLPVVFYAEQIEYLVLSTLRKMIRRPGEAGIGLIQVKGSFSAAPPGPQSGKDTIGIFANQVLKKEYGFVPEIHLDTESIPRELHTLLWIGSGSLSEKATYELDQFLMRGGNLILLAKSMDFRLESPSREEAAGIEGLKAGIAKPSAQIDDWNHIFEFYGFEINTDLVLDLNHSLSIGPLMEVEPGVIGRFPYPAWILAGKQDEMLNEENPYTGPAKSLLLPWVSSITLNSNRQPNVKMRPILQSSLEAEVRRDIVALGEKQIFATPIAGGNQRLTLGALLEGRFQSRFPKKPIDSDSSIFHLSETPKDKTSRILVFGSPYLVSDLLAYPQYMDIYQESNIPFLLNILDTVSGDTDLIQVRSKKSAILGLKPYGNIERIFLSFLNLFGIPLFFSLYIFLKIRARNSLVK
ncbi:Gldg family protein [Leptospira sp. WS92.C1]